MLALLLQRKGRHLRGWCQRRSERKDRETVIFLGELISKVLCLMALNVSLDLSIYVNLLVKGSGLFSKMSSISFIMSSVNFGTTSKDFTLLWTCSTFEAPVMALETWGFLMTQAIARAAMSHPSLSAIGYRNHESALVTLTSIERKAYLEFFDLLNILLPIIVPKSLRHSRRIAILTRRQPAIFRYSIIILARQDSHLQRTPDCQACPVILIERDVVLLNSTPEEHVVLWLLHDRTDHVQLVGETPGCGDLVGVPFGGAPVEGFALVNEIVEGADGFFDGGVAVGTVGIDKVDC